MGLLPAACVVRASVCLRLGRRGCGPGPGGLLALLPVSPGVRVAALVGLSPRLGSFGRRLALLPWRCLKFRGVFGSLSQA